ncbi:hypothetical protein HC251_14160 [Iamia sp. SCSIO 61187]|uniref:hypothetical protein n=1 Tax=Iamia sp. SCSIO 61187 TaxID=2722752 RepID=UPI001C62FA7F|nr:hypothetical protein [Iamia sp. SCSIO 61187]QYG93452.1 hypothetical protein HC251_14160 [Iamia sp. SCSIO 61187]
MDDEWELRFVRVPRGTHLSKSSETPGVERDLLREDGSNKLLGPPESRAAGFDDSQRARSYDPGPYGYDEGRDELTPEQRRQVEELGEAIGQYLVAVVFPWVGTKLREAWGHRRRWRRRKAASASADAEQVIELAVSQPSASAEKRTPPSSDRARMSIAEYEERVLVVLAAEDWLTEQRRLLASAVVTGDELPPEVETATRLALERHFPLPGEMSVTGSGETEAVETADAGAEGTRRPPQQSPVPSDDSAPASGPQTP